MILQKVSEFLEQKYFKVFGNFYFDSFYDSDDEKEDQTSKSSKKEQTKHMNLIFENLQKELKFPIQKLKSKNVILVGDFLQLHPFDEIKGEFANPDTHDSLCKIR